MGVGQLSESDAVDALRLPFYSSSHPTGSHGWRNQFDLGNPDLRASRRRTPAKTASTDVFRLSELQRGPNSLTGSYDLLAPGISRRWKR